LEGGDPTAVLPQATSLERVEDLAVVIARVDEAALRLVVDRQRDDRERARADPAPAREGSASVEMLR